MFYQNEGIAYRVRVLERIIVACDGVASKTPVIRPLGASSELDIAARADTLLALSSALVLGCRCCSKRNNVMREPEHQRVWHRARGDESV